MDSSDLVNASNWLSFLWYAKLIAAGLVAVGVAIEFGGDWISRPFERTVEEARETEIAKLSAEADSARAGIADAKAETAKADNAAAQANRRASDLERQAAEARLETARIMQSTAWRQIFPDQRIQLLNTLNTSQHKVNLVWIANDSEALSLAIQLSEVFKQAKWQVLPSWRTFPTSVKWGVSVEPNELQATQLLTTGLSKANIPFTVEPRIDEEGAMAYGTNPNATQDPEATTILIGSKRPTFSIPP